MSNNVTLDHHDAWNDVRRASPSVLDRAIELPLLAWTSVIAALAVLLAGALRLIGLDRWPLNVAEAELALAAHELVHGGTVPDDFVGAPFVIEWTALFLFAGGTMDSVARIAMAVAGILVVLGILWLTPWVGTRVAASSALLAALSPTLVALSRRIDGSILLAALSLAVIGAALYARRSSPAAWTIVAGAASGLLVLSGPLGTPAALLSWLAVYLIVRPDGAPRRDAVVTALTAFAVAIILFSTAFLTRPEALAASLVETGEQFWTQHISDAGQHWYMPAFNLILNEPLLLALAAVAILASQRRALVRATGTWFAIAFVFISAVDGAGGPGYALVTVPLVLLAGLGAAHLIERLPWSSFRRGPALLYVLSVLLLAAAAVSLLGLITGGVGDDVVEWVLRLALIITFGIVPLSLVLAAVGTRVAGSRLALVLVAGLVVLLSLTVRSSVLVASERVDNPGDPLAVDAVGSNIQPLVARIDRVSRDLTANQRTAMDPTGGHGLRIAIDENVAQPFRWYFRDYPNVTLIDPAVDPLPADAELILLGEDVDARAGAPELASQSYLYTWESPDVYTDPDWGRLLTGIVNPAEWRELANFIIDRDLATEPEQRRFQLLAAPMLAERLFPATGPYTLNDRPGTGAGHGQFNQPRGVAVAPDGMTYVVDARNGRIQVFDPSGAFVRAFGSVGTGPGQLGRVSTAGGSGASGIAIGPDGNLYVADTWNHRIQVFSPDGTVLRTWGQFFDAQDDPQRTGSEPGSFYGPRGLAFYDGLLYVTDTGNERVQVFEPDGSFVRMFGAPGSEVGQLREPVGITVSEDGAVLIADSHNARIARFTPDGQPLETWPIDAWEGHQLYEPFLATGPDGTVYATSSMDSQVLVISAAGEIGEPLWSTELRRPYGIAIGADGSWLLVTDGVLNAVVSLRLPPR